MRPLQVVLTALAAMAGFQPAHADIYTWVDAAGIVNVSNLTPPESARVTNVIREGAPKPAAALDAARDTARRVEVQALAERVRELEDEIDHARRQAPVQVEYRSVPVPTPVPYQVDPAPPPVQYAASANGGCDPSWISCGLWWGSGIYPVSVVVLRASNFRRFPSINNGHRFPAQHPQQHPMRVSGGSPRR